jgi:hypothetical protein
MVKRRWWWAGWLNNTTTQYGHLTENMSGGGTRAAVAIANTDYYSSGTRIRYNSSTPINSYTGPLLQGQNAGRGAANNAGGYTLEMVFGFRLQNSDSQFLAGMYRSDSAVSGEPSALLNVVGLALDSGDTNFQIMHNDGAGTCTKVDLGSTFARPAGAALLRDVYYLNLFCEPAGSYIDYYLLRMDDTTKFAAGRLLSNLPVNNSNSTSVDFPCAHFHGSTGPTTATAVSIELYRVACETTL